MIYASKILGLPVISFDNGEKLETVEDIIYSDKSNSVIALLVRTGGAFSTSQVLPFNKIRSLGEDAIIVSSADTIVNIDTVEDIHQSLKDQVNVRGKIIMTEDGKNLGVVSDLAIDPVSGKVLGYQASGGIFHDLYEGKPYVPAPITIKVGRDVVFVPSETANIMESQVGGLKKAAQEAATATTEVASKAKDATIDTYDRVRQGSVQAYEDAKTSLQSSETQDRIQEFKDKAAETWDKTKTVTSDFVASTTEKAKDLGAKAGDKIDEAKDGAQGKVQETQENIKQNRIQSAIGQTVKKPILATDDTVIISQGGMITHAVIEHAKRSGVIDDLLNSLEGPAEVPDKTYTHHIKADSHIAENTTQQLNNHN